MSDTKIAPHPGPAGPTPTWTTPPSLLRTAPATIGRGGVLKRQLPSARLPIVGPDARRRASGAPSAPPGFAPSPVLRPCASFAPGAPSVRLSPLAQTRHWSVTNAPLLALALLLCAALWLVVTLAAPPLAQPGARLAAESARLAGLAFVVVLPGMIALEGGMLWRLVRARVRGEVLPALPRGCPWILALSLVVLGWQSWIAGTAHLSLALVCPPLLFNLVALLPAQLPLVHALRFGSRTSKRVPAQAAAPLAPSPRGTSRRPESLQRARKTG